MKLLITFIFRYLVCLADGQYLNIKCVSHLTTLQLNPLLAKVYSQYHIIISIFTLGKNELEALCRLY